MGTREVWGTLVGDLAGAVAPGRFFGRLQVVLRFSEQPSAPHASPTTTGGSGRDPCGLALFDGVSFTGSPQTLDPRCPHLRTECSR